MRFELLKFLTSKSGSDQNSIKITSSDFAFDMEDTCTVIFRGQTWFLGGYFNERKIANLVGCNVVPKSYVLTVGHIDGVYGSCGGKRISFSANSVSI